MPRFQILKIGWALALLALITYLVAGPGTRFELWDFRTGFTLLKYGFYGALLALGAGLAGIWQSRKNRTPGLLAGNALLLLLVASLIAFPLLLLKNARQAPRIHDITTDLENPPRFHAILPLRKNAPNSADYGGAGIAALQAKGYPDLKPLEIALPPARAFEMALKRAEQMRWELVDANPAEGRIEATDTTFWFGFKDDIVIRIAPSGAGSRIDIRSVSRVGLSDVGTNARRIREFFRGFS